MYNEDDLPTDPNLRSWAVYALACDFNDDPDNNSQRIKLVDAIYKKMFEKSLNLGSRVLPGTALEIFQKHVESLKREVKELRLVICGKFMEIVFNNCCIIIKFCFLGSFFSINDVTLIMPMYFEYPVY